MAGENKADCDPCKKRKPKFKEGPWLAWDNKFKRVIVIAPVLLVAFIGSYLLLSSQAATVLRADFNGDNKVSILDLSILASNYGRSSATKLTGDADGNGTVNITDMSILSSEWGQTITPTPTPTATPKPTTTPSVTPTLSGQVVMVSGFTASAIDSAVNSAKSRGTGTTVYFPAGTYTYGYMTAWPDGINMRGDGIGKTIINFTSVKFGSNSLIGGSTENTGLTIGSTRSFSMVNNSHDTKFQWTRFRRPNSDYLWDMTDFAKYWSDPVLNNKANIHDITWSYCEFEYTGLSTASVFNIWWDSRSGGANIYNLTWDHSTFGAKNSSGVFGQGIMGLLIQPSPPEHAVDGPRPPGTNDPGGINSTNFNFNFSKVTHGSGLAAIGGSSGYGFRLTNNNFVGPASFTTFDLCDFIRAWAMVTYKLTEPGAITQAMKDAAPDSVTTKGFYVANNWMSGKYTQEIGRNTTNLNNLVRQGDTTYHVDEIVKTHDNQLYGL